MLILGLITPLWFLRRRINWINSLSASFLTLKITKHWRIQQGGLDYSNQNFYQGMSPSKLTTDQVIISIKSIHYNFFNNHVIKKIFNSKNSVMAVKLWRLYLVTLEWLMWFPIHRYDINLLNNLRKYHNSLLHWKQVVSYLCIYNKKFVMI